MGTPEAAPLSEGGEEKPIIATALSPASCRPKEGIIRFGGWELALEESWSWTPKLLIVADDVQ
jgi:hypothetical protein